MTVDVRFNGRTVAVSNEMFYGFRELAASSGLRECYMNIAEEFNTDPMGQLVDYPVNIVVGRNTYNAPAQYNELFAHILLNHELRDPVRIRFMSSILSAVRSAHLPLYTNKIMVRNVNLGLTDAFCARHGLTGQSIRAFRRIGMDRFGGFFAHVPRTVTGIPRTAFMIPPVNDPSYHYGSDDTVTFVEVPERQEQVFDHPAFDRSLLDDRMWFLDDHGLIDFYRLSPAEAHAEFERDGNQIRLPHIQ